MSLLPASAMSERPEIRPLGITVLHEPTAGAEVVADMVFVHGLQGSPDKTWLYGSLLNPTAEDKRKQSSFRLFKSKVKTECTPEAVTSPYCYWPFDLLAKDESCWTYAS